MEEEPDWSVLVPVDRQMARELVYVKNCLNNWNGHPIPSQATTVHIFNVNAMQHLEPCCFKDRAFKVFVSYASKQVAFVHEADTFGLVEEYGFTGPEKEMSSRIASSS